MGALIDYAADALGEGGVADPVEHHLGDRGLTVGALSSGLVVNGLAQAIELAGALQRVCRSHP